MSRCAQVGGEYMHTIGEFTGTAVFDGMYCFFADNVGAALFALFIVTMLTVGLINFTETLIIPIVLAIIVGPMLLFALPTVPVWIFGAVMGIVLPVLVLLVVRRIDRSTA